MASDRERSAVLGQYRHALTSEAHNLTRHPELIWQQLHNRLQWQPGVVQESLGRERERRAANRAPWIRTRTPFREPAAILRTLVHSTDPRPLPSAGLWLRAVLACAVSPDGSRIVSAGADGDVKLWDAARGTLLVTLTGHTRPVWCCAFSPDGRSVVTSSYDETVRVWDCATGAQRHVLAGHEVRVNACAVSPDGTRVISAGDDATLRVWDISSGEELTRLASSSGVSALAVSPDGAYAVLATYLGNLTIYDLAKDSEPRRLEAGTQRACAVSPDGTYIVSADDKGMLKLWDPRTGQEIRRLIGHTGRVVSCAVSGDGALVVSASADRTIRLWDPATGNAVRVLRGHSGRLFGCAVSPDAAYVVSASEDGTLIIWDPWATDEIAAYLRSERIRGWGVSADGVYVVSAGDDGQLKYVDPATSEQPVTLAQRSEWIKGLAVSPDGTYELHAIGESGDRLDVRDPRTGKRIRTVIAHWDWITAAAISPDGAYAVSASADNDRTLKVWDPATGEELRTLRGHDSGVRGCVVTPDGSNVVSSSWDKTVRVWDPATGEELRMLAGHPAAFTDCALAPHGEYVVSASGSTLELWDPLTKRRLHTLGGHTDAVSACAVSADGRYVISSSLDGTVRIWDAATGTQLRKLANAARVRDCAISPDGSFIVSVADDGVKLWDFQSGKKIHALSTDPGGPNPRACAITPDSEQVVVCYDDNDGTVTIWLSRSAEEVRSFASVPRGVVDCAIAPNGRYIVSASPNYLRLSDPATGKKLRQFPDDNTAGQGIRRCAVSADGTYVVTADFYQGLKVWDVRTGELRHELHDPTFAIACACSPDDTSVVWGTEWGVLSLLDLVTGEQRVVAGHAASFEGCAISPDGSFVVAASNDHTIELRDPVHGDELGILTGHDAYITASAVSPDGAFVISAARDRTVRLWGRDDNSPLLTLPLAAPVRTLRLHPSAPFAACLDEADNFYILEMVGIEYGPVVVTAYGADDGGSVSATGSLAGSAPVLGCPTCGQQHQVSADRLGAEVTCPTPGCATRLRVSPFVAITAREGPTETTVRCPICSQESALEPEWLGRRHACRRCGATLCVNPFVRSAAGRLLVHEPATEPPPEQEIVTLSQTAGKAAGHGWADVAKLLDTHQTEEAAQQLAMQDRVRDFLHEHPQTARERAIARNELAGLLNRTAVEWPPSADLQPLLQAVLTVIEVGLTMLNDKTDHGNVTLACMINAINNAAVTRPHLLPILQAALDRTRHVEEDRRKKSGELLWRVGHAGYETLREAD